MITKQDDGKVDYQLEASAFFSPAINHASNRQKKLLRFFGVAFNPNISAGAAGWEIGAIMASEGCRERWRQYLFLTKDFDSETEFLKPFDVTTLNAVQIPADWSSADAFQQFQDELVANILHDESPHDRPQPVVSFSKRAFMFTGKFTFGTRKACQDAVIARGGSAPDHKEVSHLIHYLVIGMGGSKTWKKGAYGNKIETAILARREHGSPAIISEEHWANVIRTL